MTGPRAWLSERFPDGERTTTPHGKAAVLIGAGVMVERMARDGEAVGLSIWFPNAAKGPDSATPGWCVGGVRFGPEAPDGTGWNVDQERPLTLSPSIKCLTHPDTEHGFIREGRWVSV